MLTLRLLGGHILEGVSLEATDTQHAVYKKDDKYCMIPRSAIVCIEGDEQAAIALRNLRPEKAPRISKISGAMTAESTSLMMFSAIRSMATIPSPSAPSHPHR